MKSETVRSPSTRFRRGFGLAVSVGGTIGVGILRTPGLVAEQPACAIWRLFVVGCGRYIHIAWRELLDGVGVSCSREPAASMFMRRRAFATQRDLPSAGLTGSCNWSILGICRSASPSSLRALGLIPGGAVRVVAVLILLSIVAFAMAGHPHQQSISRSDHFTQMRCVFWFLFWACLLVPAGEHGLPRVSHRRDIQRINSRPAGPLSSLYGGWHKPLVFHRGRSRSGTQSSRER